MNALSHRWRVGFDIGGTFTDFVLYDGENASVKLHKRLTTPHDPSEAALLGLQELLNMQGIGHADVSEIVHGTTLVTNAVIERKGSPVGLITTRGFRDILEMGTEQRYDIYDLFVSFPDPMVSRDLRLEVDERMTAQGKVVTPLDEAAVLAAAKKLVAEGCEAIALMFLHSYINPAHEKRAAEIIRAAFPELLVSLSSDVVAEMGEYQRAVTTCANAFVQPLMNRYLTKMEGALRASGFDGALRLMHSAGGLVSLETARDFPIRLLESGPAGGGLATALFGQAAGQKDVISFDMGGTTAKACMIEDGRAEISPMMEAARVHRFTKGSGLPIKAPVIEMIEIGAGGGSIAAIDEVGLLKVGPHSAGSDPGPACYGMGGEQPTVTDANLVLGYYDPGFFLGGRMKLDLEAARTAIARVAEPLGLGVEEAALGIHKVVVESMAAAARVHLVERGKDPRDYSMVGFGGAGPAHATDVARAMGISSVLIPPASGAASALGFLAAPLSHDGVRSMRIELTPGFDAAALNGLLRDLEEEGLHHLTRAGIAREDAVIERSADMRLVGQMHDISVDLPDGEIGEAELPAIREAFTRAYSARYAEPFEGARFETVNFRVRVAGPTPQLALTGAAGGGDMAAKIKGHRQCWFDEGEFSTAVYDRYSLGAGDVINGPAIIEERESTTVVGPADSVTIDAGLNLCVQIGAVKAGEALVTPEMSRAQAVARIEADPIGLEIMWSRLVNVVEEMWLTVCRTAFSLVIAEAQDFACELLDRDGETLAHSPRAMPVFNLTLPRAVKALLKRYPAETLKPGDVLITNDPWLCAGHLFDIAIVTPAFRDGRLVGLMGTVGHVSDIGGTKDSLHAREIYEEGLQIPPMKLFEAGRPNETLVEMIRQNVRNGEQVLGDVFSFVAANKLGAERLESFMRDYGMHDLGALAEVVQGLSEKAMRDAIRALPDGDYRSEITNNPLGEKISYPVLVKVEGDDITVDFDGVPPQLPQGGLNSTLNYTAAHATYPLKCMLTPTVRGNAGCYRPFTVTAPEGSILNPTYPASVNLRTRTGWYLAPNIFRAIADAAPHQVQSFTGLCVAANIYGQDRDGRFYSDMLFCGGGQGGSERGDGKSALLWPTSAANTSIELMESRVPVLVLEKSLLSDSGGPGRHRGGLGQIVRFCKRDADGQSALVSVYPEGVDNPIDGLFGGLPGMGAVGRVLSSDGRLLRDCGAGELVSVSSPDEIVEIVLAGGSGYGDPVERDPALISRDLALGFVTPEHVSRHYRHIPEAAAAEASPLDA
ncbi:hydantoinase B/oxoprolinase family protein [Paracoccus saliphilus]|uniref:5-oxoprolinase (ATP-hydrolysing)/N-methylhydantoinase A n=1 Tax=Paracoccus saliphilus TaxID=405559 RepID=A0AA45W6U0_9RHOB|nr:hydantoinase B/oxoprolinase family protein [Paracoccus saliphilus]WCR03782.1 hydantoinase B/oxoprolinase family protein [Paracoccus saliphilus]SIT04617.1 5-oxoprolinase (ATP-hydrolysing)/N-methylhydantoinase A [Paracoccus saliphilus]